MKENILAKLFEHNNWANLKVVHTCCALTDGQLDSKPQSGTDWSIRRTLLHLVGSQKAYLSLLTMPLEERPDTTPTFAELEEVVRASGEGLLALAKEESSRHVKTRIQTKDGYLVEPWVVMLQAINHATEHRRQISGMLRALRVAPPGIDGWSYGEATKALISIST